MQQADQMQSASIAKMDIIRFEFGEPVVGHVIEKDEASVPVFDPRVEDYHAFVDRVTKRPK